MANSASEDKWKKDLVRDFPQVFNGDAKILEIGSAIAWNKALFPAREYIGLDVAEGLNVDVVSIAHKYKAPKNSFDVVCSFSVFEHDMYWKKTLKKMYELTKPKGLILFSCCMNWEEHGTLNTSPEQSYTTQIDPKWANYYRNITPDDIKTVWDCKKLFSEYYLGLNPYDDGLTCFWGFKK